MAMQTLDGKGALVPGSTRGIGAAIARNFARHGAAVAVQLEAVRSGAAAPRDESKVDADSGQDAPALAGTA